MKQTESGKAFEFQLALEISKFLNIPFVENSEKIVGERFLSLCDEREQYKIQRAADEACVFIRCHDNRFKDVLLPKKHSMYGKKYDKIDEFVCVHGGLTFSEKAEDYINWEEIKEEDKDCWLVGFDTVHLFDSLSNWPKERVLEETQKLAKQLEKCFSRS